MEAFVIRRGGSFHNAFTRTGAACSTLLACVLAPATAFGARSRGHLKGLAVHRPCRQSDGGRRSGEDRHRMTETGYDNSDLEPRICRSTSRLPRPRRSRLAASTSWPRRWTPRSRRTRRSATARTRSSTSGAATPSPAASPTRCARSRPRIPDVMKLEQIGTSTLGKPILAIKMTEDARNTPDGTRPALLFSAINHAREWVAAEQGRRLPIWFAQHKNDPKIKEIIGKTELWFLPIQNVDGYDFTFTCGIGATRSVRLPRPHRATTTASGARRSATTTTTASTATASDGVDPNRNYPAKRAIDEEGASNTLQRRDLPRPVRALRAREPRRRPAAAPRQVPRQHQLPHRRPAAADPGVATRPTTRRRTRRSSRP